jgi:GH15 family glucan-1,4-alpha-glucosidase
MARTGHAQEAKMAMDFLLDAAPVGVGKYSNWFEVKDYRISTVRYFGTGEEDSDFSGHPTPNIEVDGWGMALWGARQYVDASGDVAWLSTPTKLDPSKTVYQVLIDGIAKPLESFLEPNFIVKKDSGIWEVHQGNARHFAYTTLSAARGFCDMAALARRVGNDADATKYKDLYGKVAGAFGTFFKDNNNAFVGSGPGEGKTSARIDASVVEVFTWNIVKDYKAAYVKPTFDLLSQLQVQSGGYKRNDEAQSSYDNHEWILIDLRMADALRRYGDTARADQLIDTIVGKSAVNFYLIPELYSAVSSEAPIGNYWGSIPMVGYGAAAYMMTLFDRDGLIEPFDCGTAAPPPVDGGGGGSGGTGSGGSAGTGAGSGAGGTNEPGQGGAAGCDDPLICGGVTINASTADIPRKGACLCSLDGASSSPGQWLSLGLIPLAFVGRRWMRRRAARP